MKELTFLVSLITRDNDYQREQAAAAEETAMRLGAKLQLVYAEGDAINQSQQILAAVQSPAGVRPDGIVFEPAGTGLAQVAHAAAKAGIGWAVLNREVEYIAELRAAHRIPMFSLSSDHVEVGRIQGRQMGALLPNGGLVLYIEGPSSTSAASQRTQGMHSTKPSNIQLRTIKGQWTEESAYQALTAWLRLSTSHQLPVVAVVAQNDSMAAGAKKAFENGTAGAERERWMNLPFTGCDGVPQTGIRWVETGLLAATVVVPPNTGAAMEMMAEALKTSKQPPEHSLTEPKSFPPLARLAPKNSAVSGR
jgi:ABC-type sugar transport system substrate-binding protein